MACEHKQIKNVNCVKYCLLCGARLPDDWGKPQEETKAAEKPTRRKGAKAK